jgi:hypothetical protein
MVLIAALVVSGCSDASFLDATSRLINAAETIASKRLQWRQDLNADTSYSCRYSQSAVVSTPIGTEIVAISYNLSDDCAPVDLGGGDLSAYSTDIVTCKYLLASNSYEYLSGVHEGRIVFVDGTGSFLGPSKLTQGRMTLNDGSVIEWCPSSEE